MHEKHQEWFTVSGGMEMQNVDQFAEAWSRLGNQIEFAHLQIPATEFNTTTA
jgi:hypothetical protein